MATIRANARYNPRTSSRPFARLVAVNKQQTLIKIWERQQIILLSRIIRWQRKENQRMTQIKQMVARCTCHGTAIKNSLIRKIRWKKIKNQRMTQIKRIVARYTCDGTAKNNSLIRKIRWHRKENQRMTQMKRIVARYTCDGTAIKETV